MKADAAAKTQDLQDRIGRKRDERDIKKAEREAEGRGGGCRRCPGLRHMGHRPTELAVLDAIDARVWGRRAGRSVARKLTTSGFAGLGCVAAPWSTPVEPRPLIGARGEVWRGS